METGKSWRQFFAGMIKLSWIRLLIFIFEAFFSEEYPSLSPYVVINYSRKIVKKKLYFWDLANRQPFLFRDPTPPCVVLIMRFLSALLDNR